MKFGVLSIDGDAYCRTGETLYICGKTRPPRESKDGYEDMRNGTLKIKKWRGGYWCQCSHKSWSLIYAYLSLIKFGVPYQKLFMMETINYINGKSLSKYFGELIEFFWEFDHHDKVVMKDLENITTYGKFIEWLRVHIFLFGLDIDFEQVCG